MYSMKNKIILQLKPSKIHKTGIGVFSTKPIKKGSVVPLWNDKDWRIIKDPKGQEKDLCNHFCLTDDRIKNKFHCPKDWNYKSIGWYINDSANPNISYDGGKYKAIRNIGANKELTVNYDDLE